jgi:hypothetical protein
MGRMVGCSRVVAVRRCRRRRGRPSVTILTVVVRRIRLLVRRIVVLWRHIVWRLPHGCPGEGGRLICVSHARLGVHPLDRDDVPESRIIGRLREIRLAWLRAGVVGDEMEMLASRGSDAEGLLHQTIGLVAVTLGLTIVVVLVAGAAAVGRLAGSPAGAAETAPSFALHLSIREKASRDPTGAPRFPIRPSPHASFPLVPNEDRT